MRLQKYIHPSEKHRDYDSANFKSLTLFGKLILDMILFISVTPFSYPRTKVEKNGDGYGEVVDDCKAKEYLWCKGWAGQWGRCCEKACLEMEILVESLVTP